VYPLHFVQFDTDWLSAYALIVKTDIADRKTTKPRLGLKYICPLSGGEW
jgi:hypothetical protein